MCMVDKADRLIAYRGCLKKYGIAATCYIIHLHEAEENYEECAAIQQLIADFCKDLPEIPFAKWDEKELATAVRKYNVKNPVSYIQRTKAFALDVLDTIGILMEEPAFDNTGIESKPPRVQPIRPE